MKYRFGVLAVLLVIISAAAQLSSSSRLFRWNSRDARELSSAQRIYSFKSLTGLQRQSLIDTIVAQLKASAEDFDSDSQFRDAASDSRVALVELGNNKTAVAVQAWGRVLCGATGNCRFWLLQRNQNRYSVLLDGVAETFTIQPSRTHDLHDIVLSMHSSATESELVVFQFNGERYTRAACYLAKWDVIGSDGEFHRRREPRLIPCTNH